MERNGKSKFEHLDDTTVNIIMDVGRMAWEIAKQAMPILWPKLHADLNRSESLPDELAKFLRRQLYGEAYEYVTIITDLSNWEDYLEDQGLGIKNFLHGIGWEVTLRPGIESPLVRRVYTVFLRQLVEYRKKYKEDMSQTIVKAIKKDAMSICRLLEWDKTWIEFGFVHNEISARGYLYSTDSNKRFLEMVGDAILKKPHVKRYTERSGVLSAIALLENRFSLSKNKKRLLKKFHSSLVRAGAFDSGTDDDPLNDFQYFKKYLKRHYII